MLLLGLSCTCIASTIFSWRGPSGLRQVTEWNKQTLLYLFRGFSMVLFTGHISKEAVRQDCRFKTNDTSSRIRLCGKNIPSHFYTFNTRQLKNDNIYWALSNHARAQFVAIISHLYFKMGAWYSIPLEKVRWASSRWDKYMYPSSVMLKCWCPYHKSQGCNNSCFCDKSEFDIN